MRWEHLEEHRRADPQSANTYALHLSFPSERQTRAFADTIPCDFQCDRTHGRMRLGASVLHRLGSTSSGARRSRHGFDGLSASHDHDADHPDESHWNRGNNAVAARQHDRRHAGPADGPNGIDLGATFVGSCVGRRLLDLAQ